MSAQGWSAAKTLGQNSKSTVSPERVCSMNPTIRFENKMEDCVSQSYRDAKPWLNISERLRRR